MDIQHISALIETLSSLGFSSSTGRTLLFNACLQQKNFIIRERMHFGADTINYQLYFKEDTVSKELTCSYYDATLRKAAEISASVVNGIDVPDLEKRMGSVNWEISSDNHSSEDFDITDQNTWKQETVMEEITTDLEMLASTQEGTALANTLKYKFWTDPALQNLIPELSVIKSKYELSQRFYVIDGNGITASEAYRYLNNRWMERKIHASNRLLHQNETELREAKTGIKRTGNKKGNKHSKRNVES